VYGDEIVKLIPDSSKIQKIVPFVPRDKETGNKYHSPVILSNEHGIAYAAFDGGAFPLSKSVSMTMKDAQITGSQMCLRSSLSYDAAARASNSKKAFVKGTDLLVENMVDSMSKRLEVAMIYGASPTGLATVTCGTSDGTTVIATVSAASFAYGIWAGMENAEVVLKVSSTIYGPYAISAINFDNRTLSLILGTSLTSAQAGAVSGALSSIASQTATVYFSGAPSNEMAGLDAIISNTGSLFNIDAAVYSLWRGNSVTVSGQLSLGKILSGVSKAVQKGLNEKVVCVVNPDTWANLATDLAALRKFDSSYDSKEGDNGFESLKYYGQNGEIEILPHSCVKAGDCFIFPPKRAKRIGAQEISFKTPGREDEIFLHLGDSAGFELRSYTDQALFIETPARTVKISGFTNI
jgi:hypothetical protein